MLFQRRNMLVLGISLLVLSMAIVLGNSYVKKEELTTSVDFIMDTVVELQLTGPNSQEAAKEINKSLRTYESTYSMHMENSDIWRINQNAGIQFTTVSSEVLELIQKSISFSEQTNGLFDVTIAPLTSLWNITGQNPKIPEQSEIEKAKSLVNYKDILIEGNQVMLQHPSQAIDLGGIAKGNACEIIREVTAKYGVKIGYASIGGNMVVLEENPRVKPYLFGIRDPQGRPTEYIGSLSLNGKTMATTGGYERFFEIDGKKYHHVLNPKTGYPAESDFLSVTVVSEDGALADFFSTALFILGKDATIKAMEEPSIGIVAVDIYENVWISKSLEDYFVPNKESLYHFQYI